MLYAELLHSAALTAAEVSKGANGSLTVLFRSTRSGLHRLRATVNDASIVNLIPSAVNISAGRIHANAVNISGLSPDMPFVAGVPGVFSLVAKDVHSNLVTSGGGRFVIDVENDDHTQAVVGVANLSDGTYNVSVLATIAGLYTATIRHDGSDILNSPFQVRIGPGGACIYPDLLCAHLQLPIWSCLMVYRLTRCKLLAWTLLCCSQSVANCGISDTAP